MNIKITVLTLVYNEENRIGQFLSGLAEFDQILMIDKSSTDRTVEIARAYPNVQIYVIPYTDIPSIAFNPVLPEARNEWVFNLTASDWLSQELKDYLSVLADQEQDFDIVDIPYRTHILGYWDERSPWHNGYARPICRKKYMFFRDTVHGEFEFRSDRIFQIPNDGKLLIRHLTHPNVDQLMERHLRYTRMETAQKSPDEINLVKEKKELWRLFFRLVVKKRLPFIKNGGFELFLSFMSYFIFRYLFMSEKINGTGADRYKREFFQQHGDKK